MIIKMSSTCHSNSNSISSQINLSNRWRFWGVCVSPLCLLWCGQTQCTCMLISWTSLTTSGFSFHARGWNQQKHLSFLRPLVELISCFLAVNKQACCNPLDKYRREYSNQLKAICMSVLEPAARDFLPVIYHRPQAWAKIHNSPKLLSYGEQDPKKPLHFSLSVLQINLDLLNNLCLVQHLRESGFVMLYFLLLKLQGYN